MTRRGLGPAKRRDAKGEARRQIGRPRSIAAASLEEEALRDALLYRLAARPAYYAGSNVPANIRTFPDEVFLKREHLGPDLVESANIAGLAPGKIDGQIPNDKIAGMDGGKLQKRSVPADALARVDGRDLLNRSVPPDAIIGVRYEDVLDRPDLSGFVRSTEVKKFLTVKEADDRYQRRK